MHRTSEQNSPEPCHSRSETFVYITLLRRKNATTAAKKKKPRILVTSRSARAPEVASQFASKHSSGPPDEAKPTSAPKASEMLAAKWAAAELEKCAAEKPRSGTR